MAILGSIRKRGIFLILVIGLALFAFVVGDIFNRGGGPTSQTLATINGEEVSMESFSREVDQVERQYGNISSTRAANIVWDRKVRQAVLSEQFDELGIDLGKDGLFQTLASNPGFSQDPRFSTGGQFDQEKFTEWIADLKQNDPNTFAIWESQEDGIINSARERLYFNLIKAGSGATIKEGELEYRMENDKADIKYVQIPYQSILDSTIVVSDSEIEQYINDHEDQFEVEASRDMQYVFFSEEPSDDDFSAAKEVLAKLAEDRVEYNDVSKLSDTLPGLKNAANYAEFINNNSDIKFEDKFKFEEQLSVAEKEELLSLSVNEVKGPYKDGKYFKLSKLIAIEEVPDSVKTAHIIIPFQGSLAADAQTTLTKEAAKSKIDSIFRLVRNNKDKFAEVADSINTDGTKGKGGDIGWMKYSQINDENFDRDFSDFMYFGNKGDIDVVETKFGYHIIRVDDQKDVKKGYKFATLAQEVIPSENTSNDIFAEATKFEIASGKGVVFADVAKESNYNVRQARNIKALDENLPGLSNQRSIVKWAFEEDAEIGDVKRFNVPGGYAVVQLTAKQAEGIAGPESVKARVLPILRKQKKAAQIIEKYKGETTITGLSSASGQVARTAIDLSMKTPTLSGVGREPKVVGAAFGLDLGQSSGLIEGDNGVFMVELTKLEKAPDLDNYVTFANTVRNQRQGKVNTAVYNALKEAADIEDNRKDFY